MSEKSCLAVTFRSLATPHSPVTARSSRNLRQQHAQAAAAETAAGIPNERVSKMADQQIWTSGDKVAAAGITTAIFAGLGAVLSRVFTDQMDKENREANR
jgi:hypothetical protein